MEFQGLIKFKQTGNLHPIFVSDNFLAIFVFGNNLAKTISDNI